VSQVKSAHNTLARYYAENSLSRATEWEDKVMQAVVRTYSGSGAKALFDVLEKQKADVEKQMRSVKGFVSYTLVRSGDGGLSVTVCQDKAGIDESVQRAKDWVAKNAGSTGVGAPSVAAGSVILHLK
jgi:hypothetical protein